ncbi:MAG TPA: FAD-binding oxidoreductase, partial [Chromatiales bacterium]|nr:FAD-binding oxidoreductase [Chromatiales bacterium]
MGDHSVTPEFRRALENAAGRDAVSFDEAERLTYGYDNSRRQAMPDAVAWCAGHDRVEAVTRVCYEHGVPLVT